MIESKIIIPKMEGKEFNNRMSKVNEETNKFSSTIQYGALYENNNIRIDVKLENQDIEKLNSDYETFKNLIEEHLEVEITNIEVK